MRQEPPIPAELWDQIPPAVQAALLLVFQQYEQRIAALEQRVRELDERLNQNSTNSSRPPSSDAPAVQRAPPRSPSGRPRGGQNGHALQQRPLLPADQTHVLKPAACRGCGHTLAGNDRRPLRHQVLELPAIQPEVTEYQLHRLQCPRCGLSTCATLPAGVPRGGQGPRLQSVLALMTGAYRLSKRMVQTFCADVFALPICAGQVCALEAQTTAATAAVVEALREHVQTRPANVDETGWRQERCRGWLWTVVTASVTIFTIALSRAAGVARELVDPSAGQVITSDRFPSYDWLPLRQRQICWAHLQRDFQAMVDRANTGSPIGEELLCCAEDLFTWWYRVRDGTLSRSTFRQYMSAVRGMVRDQLAAGLGCGCAKTEVVCRNLLALEPALWTFVRVEGIEPTNNAAERALRHAVQWRKTSYGTDSAGGSRFVENILSIVATCRQQGRHVLEFLTQCCEAYVQGKKPPSLLPASD
jgi:transposase